jgi:hypothetical protein
MIETVIVLVVIGTDCIGNCISNYHTITATTAPWNVLNVEKIKYRLRRTAVTLNTIKQTNKLKTFPFPACTGFQ